MARRSTEPPLVTPVPTTRPWVAPEGSSTAGKGAWRSGGSAAQSGLHHASPAFEAIATTRNVAKSASRECIGARERWSVAAALREGRVSRIFEGLTVTTFPVRRRGQAFGRRAHGYSRRRTQAFGLPWARPVFVDVVERNEISVDRVVAKGSIKSPRWPATRRRGEIRGRTGIRTARRVEMIDP